MKRWILSLIIGLCASAVSIPSAASRAPIYIADGRDSGSLSEGGSDGLLSSEKCYPCGSGFPSPIYPSVERVISAYPIEPATVRSPLRSAHSKLGIHGINPGEILAYVHSAVDGGTRMSVVKAVNNLSYLETVKVISPETVTVARLTSPHEGASMVNDDHTNLEWYAGVIMDVIFDKIDLEPELADIVDYWEPINEPLGGGVPVDAYERLAELMIYCMELAEARGLRLALFSFNAGTPEWVDMNAIVETGVFARAKAGGHILAVHEGVFGADDPIDLWYGPDYTIPGAPALPDTGALAGRYRFWYHLLEQRNEVVPLFVSEFYAGGGYGGNADVNDIVARMAWYDNQLRSDDYALGFGPFTLGPSGQWVNQDYGFAYPALIDYMIEAVITDFVFLPLIVSHEFGTLQPGWTPATGPTTNGGR